MQPIPADSDFDFLGDLEGLADIPHELMIDLLMGWQQVSSSQASHEAASGIPSEIPDAIESDSICVEVTEADPNDEDGEREFRREVQRARVDALVEAGFTLDALLLTATRLYIDEHTPINLVGSGVVELGEAVLRGF